MEFSFREIWNYKLINIGETGVNLSSIIFFTAFIIAVSFLLKFLKKLIYRSQKLDESKRFTIFSLIRYFTYVLSFILGMNMIGINVSVLLGASAALLVGVGLGLQNIFSDFVSGIVLLLDSTLKVGDIIEVEKLVCEVKEINLRTTSVLTRDDKFIILPNTFLTKNNLVNWTHSNINSRFDIQVGVSYDTEVTRVMTILKEITERESRVSADPKPFVRFNDFGDSALIFNVYFWTPDVFRAENLKSDLRIKYFEALRENNIEIPFPQRVLHLNNT